MNLIRFYLFLALISIGITSCTSTPKRDHTFIAIPDKVNTIAEKHLSVENIEYDKEQIIYSLTNIYSGRKHLPKGQHKDLINKIEKIKGPLTTKAFCHKIDSYFEQVSDNHLNAKFGGSTCVKSKVRRKSSVGKNYYKDDKIPWDVRLKKKSNKTALLISITSFYKRTSPVWDSFLDKVKQNLPKAELVIIDMRGNGGGDDSIGYELSTLLAGKELKTPYTDQWTSHNPASFQLWVNTFESWGRYHKKKSNKIPEYIKDLKAEFVTKLNRSLNGENFPFWGKESSKKETKPIDMNFEYAKSIKKPIYILIDAGCASSCESTTDFFEFNTLVKTIGERTAGYIHFGNNGEVFLKNSGIILQMAVSYNQYYDGRFIEKVGITPKIQVPPGKDAMSYAWVDFLN